MAEVHHHHFVLVEVSPNQLINSLRDTSNLTPEGLLFHDRDMPDTGPPLAERLFVFRNSVRIRRNDTQPGNDDAATHCMIPMPEITPEQTMVPSSRFISTRD